MAPLLDATGKQYGMAQGPISVGGYNIETSAGEKVRKNHALTGRIPAGAVMNNPLENNTFDFAQPIRFLLHEPDFVTATRIAEGINNLNISDSLVATTLNAGVVEIQIPDSLKTPHLAVGFLAGIEALEIAPDVEARVVINERTGTVVSPHGHCLREESRQIGGLECRIAGCPRSLLHHPGRRRLAGA